MSIEAQVMTTTLVASPLPTAHVLPLTPYTVVIDTAEQQPYQFLHPLVWEANRKGRTFRVQTTTGKLFIAGTRLSSDYSVLGYHQTGVIVERKSLSDFLGTLGQTRARFEEKLKLINSTYEFGSVVVEAEWSQILNGPHPYSQLNLKSAYMSVLAWKQRYSRVHWEFVPGREFGEATTIRILDRWWRERNA
jgi:ERCC4-type nuclease